MLAANHGTGRWAVQYFTGGEAIVTRQYKLVTGDMHKGPFGDGTGDPSCDNATQFPAGMAWALGVRQLRHHWHHCGHFRRIPQRIPV